MTLLCITNTMPDTRPCTHKNQHTIRCDGNQYRWNEDRQREEATGRLCNGCLPRLAQKGHLCWGCWERVEQALTDWPGFARMIAGVERAVQRDNAGVRSQSVGYVPMSGTVLAVEEIRSYLRTLTGHVDVWVASAAGAADAVRFARAMSAALRTHAVEEKAHKLQRLRCPNCRQLSFNWNPPTAAGGRITVKCQNAACGKTITEHERTKTGEEKINIVADIETRIA